MALRWRHLLAAASITTCLMSIPLQAGAPLHSQDRESDFAFADPEVQALHEFARQCAGQGFYGRAAEAYETALGKFRDTASQRILDVAQLHLLLAGAYRSLGEPSKALSHLHDCVSASQSDNGGTNVLAASALNHLGMLAAQGSQDRDAEKFYQRSLQLLEQLPGQGDRLAAAVAMNLGLPYFHQAKFTQSAPLFDRALAFVEDPTTGETVDVAQMLNTLAWVLYRTGRQEKAKQLAYRSLEIRERLLGVAHPDLADSFDLLAEFAFDSGDTTRELAWLRLDRFQ